MSGTVLVRRSALGDVVLLGAITASVPRPVTVVTDARYVPLAARLRGVDHAVAFGEHQGVQGRVIDLQGSLATRRAFPGAARIHKRSVRRRMWLWWGVGDGRPPVPVLYAEAAGVEAWRPPWFDLPPRPRDTLLLVPGAAHRPKRPPTRLLVAAAHAWEGPVRILGGPGEEEEVHGLAEHVPGATTLVETGFERTLEAMAQGAACVSGDTGLMHLAGACGCPVLAVFGPTHPADGFGVHDGAVVQRHDLSCRPCALHRVARCRMGDHACMDLDVDELLAALRRITGASCAGSC
jgi:hypothetical protein